ncbi:hypothetical protein GF373_01580, partial [bacterium]|nr:hypothetical protein [bacterium]
HEWCLVRPVMDLEAVIPMNRSAYLMRVKDRQQAEAGLQKVFRAMIETLEWPLKLETLNHKDVPITSLTLPIPVPIRPSWCITDENLLLLATDTDLIREILEIQAGSRTGIERNYNYRQLRELLQTKGNMFTFQDVEEEFYTYREALRRVAAVLDQAAGMDENIEQDDEAFKGMLLMDRASYLLRCLQIFKGSVKVSNTQEGGLFTNQRVLMKDLRTVPSLQSVIQYKISLLPPNEIAKIIDNLIQEDSPKEAIRYYRILVEFYPNNPDFLSRLAALYKKTGQAQDAVEAYNISLDIMPNTALLIEREKIRNADSAQTIMQHVNEEADKTRRIDRNMALFGIALHKRDTGQPDITEALLQAVEPGSKVGDAAKQELFLLTGELPPVGMAVPLAEQNIEIDGNSKDTAWEKADAYPLFSSSSSEQDAWTARVKLLRDETYLYILLSGKDPVPIEQIKNQTFQIIINADRDYASLKTFHVEMKKHEEETVFIERIKEDKVNIMDLVLKEKDRKKDKLGSYWRKEISCEGQYWQMEIALPLLELWDGAARKDQTLLLNILRNVKTENHGQNTQTLIQSTDPNDVFKYRCIKLAD